MSYTQQQLILYHFDGCPYCTRVERALQQLGLEIEHRNILENTAYRDELKAARGRTTVPVLRIQGEEETWMPESADIVVWLEEQFPAGPGD